MLLTLLVTIDRNACLGSILIWRVMKLTWIYRDEAYNRRANCAVDIYTKDSAALVEWNNEKQRTNTTGIVCSAHAEGQGSWLAESLPRVPGLDSAPVLVHDFPDLRMLRFESYWIFNDVPN